MKLIPSLDRARPGDYDGQWLFRRLFLFDLGSTLSPILIAQQVRFIVFALSRRRILGGLLLSLGLSSLFGQKATAAPRDGFVIVNGWVLKRSDLDLMR